MATLPHIPSMSAPANGPPQTVYQETLFAECRSRNWREPTFQIYSDRRGGRTAWSAAVTVEGRSIAARLWYDGSFINSAREEAAQLAVQTIRAEARPPPQQNGNVHSSSHAHRW